MTAPTQRSDSGPALFRFLLVGGLAALAYSLVTAGLVNALPQPPALISALVWLAFLPPVFWCHRHFTFQGRQPRKQALGLYALIQALSIAIVSLAGAFFVTHDLWLDLGVYLAASAVAAVVSFALNHILVFPNAN